MILVPLFDLKFLNELAAGGVGTSNRRHYHDRKQACPGLDPTSAKGLSSIRDQPFKRAFTLRASASRLRGRITMTVTRRIRISLAAVLTFTFVLMGSGGA